MSSEQPTGDFPQQIVPQPPYPVAPPLTWSAPLATPLQTPVELPASGPPIDQVNPILAKYDVPEVVPSVNPGPDWGSIANGLPVDVPKPYVYTVWTKLNHSQYHDTDLLTEGTYVEGMGTLVRSIVVSPESGIAVSTSFLPGVKIADGKLVPFNYEC